MNGDGIRGLLAKYGAGVGTARQHRADFEAMRLGPSFMPPSPDTPALFSPEEVAGLGLTAEGGEPFVLEAGWQLKLTPGANGAEPTFSLITPERWEIFEDQSYLSPEGQKYTLEELEAAVAQEGVPLGLESIFGEGARELERWTGEPTTPGLYAAAFSDEQIWGIYAHLFSMGRTPEMEALMKEIGFTPAEIEEFYNPPDITEAAWRAYEAAKIELLTGEFAWGEVGDWFMAKLGVAGAYFHKYIGRPWEWAVIETMIWGQQLSGQWVSGQQQEFLRHMIEAENNYGWGLIYSPKIDELWESYWTVGGATGYVPPSSAKTAAEWSNPVFWMPIGGAFGLGAKLTSRVPVVGRAMERTAAGVIAAERGIAAPAVWGVRGMEKVGERLGAAAVNRLIKQTDHLVLFKDIHSLTNKEILDKILVDTWQRRVINLAAKIPPIRVGIENVLGWRVLVRREGQALADIVGQAAVLHGYFRRMGINIQNPIIWSLRAIEGRPQRLFGFGRNAFSGRMFKRLLPEYKGTANAGTLEHVFTHPEMYRLTDKMARYVTRFNELNTEVLNLLKAEGIAPKNVLEDWIHRVVETEGRRVRRGGRAIGRMQPFEKPRRFETMADGIQWFAEHPELGARYASNPEISIAAYVGEAFNKIADERFVKYLSGFEQVAGLKPSQILLERYPELAQRAILRAEEFADAKKFTDIINRAIRGERIPSQTLRAIERRFPEEGARLRALVEAPSLAEKELRALLLQNQSLIRSLEAKLAKAEAIDIGAIRTEARLEARAAMPNEDKLLDAFRVMDYEDRLAFRATMGSQLDDVLRVSTEESNQLAALKETLALDPVANLRFRIPYTRRIKMVEGVAQAAARGKGYREVDLGFFISIKEQAFPEYFTLKQARILNPSANLTTFSQRGVRTYNRVPRDVALDDLTRRLKMSADEIAESVMRIRADRLTIKDLEWLVGMANERYAGIKRMLGILDNVDSAPRHIPKAEPGMPEAGVQRDIFGYEMPHYPAGKGQITQISMDDYAKLVELHKKAGIPPPDIAIKPKIDGVPGLEAASQVRRVKFEPPPQMTAAQRRQALEALRAEVRSLTEARRVPYWEARSERAFRMTQLRQPGLEEGYIMQPFAGGKIYGQEFIDTFNKFFGHEAGLKILKATSDVAGILRITKAALDFSFMAIQGLPAFGLAHAYLLTNPAIGVRLMGSWWKAFGEAVGIFFNRGILARAMEKQLPIATQRIGMGGSSRAIDYFAALQARGGIGGIAARGMERIPLTPYQRAEASFLGAGEIIRNDFWAILQPRLSRRIRAGLTPAHAEGELARFLDIMTGITESSAMGVPLTIRQLEQSFMWFAPNYTRACLTVLADIFRGGMSGAMARRALGGLISAGVLYYTATQFSISLLQGKTEEEAWRDVMEGFCIVEDPITGETTWQPSGRLMTLEIGNYRFGVGGFWYGLVRLTGNILDVIEDDQERVDFYTMLKTGEGSWYAPFMNWWFTRASPLTGTGFELATGRDYLGYPIETPAEYARYIATRFEPIWMEQGINWMIPGFARDNEIPEDAARAAIIPAELMGLRTFPDSAWVKFYDKANEYIQRIPREELDPKQIEGWEEGTLTWKHLTDIQQQNLLARYPDLMEFYEAAQADSAVRDSSIWQAWSSRMDEERAIYYERIDELVQRLLSGEIDTREFRERAGDAGQNYGYALEAIERDPHYFEIYEYFAKKEAEGDDYGFRDDLALGEYLTQIAYAEDLVDAKGDYDWDERDRRIDAFIEKWGQPLYDRILEYIVQKKELAELNPVWIRKAEDTEQLGRSYWRLPYKPIDEMTAEDAAEGNIPAEYLELWRQYQTLETDAEKEAFLLQHPDLARDWRAEYRQQNPEADAMLALWGYGGKLQTMDAYNLVVEWGKELGIPLEQMGLGLPPHSLINDYFSCNQLVAQFGGNSAEVRLFKLTHPAYLTWGLDQEIWSDDLSGESIEALQISVTYRAQDTQYEGYGRRGSEFYIPDSAARAEARENFLAENPEYARARRQRDAYNINFPPTLIDTYVEYYEIPPKSEVSWYNDYPSISYYEPYWFLMEHPDFYRAMISVEVMGDEAWEPWDFSKVPSRAVFALFQIYLGLPLGKDRYDYRAKHPELDAWLVEAKDYTPVGKKGDEEAEKTPWEEAAEAEKALGWIQNL